MKLFSRRPAPAPPSDVDDCGAVLFACMDYAPSEKAVIQALRNAGMPA